MTHAVMSNRHEAADSLDNFPTPPWATRALIEHVIDIKHDHSCLEPACGAGHMVKPLREYFREVKASDVYNYQFGEQRDFLANKYDENSFDWIITNPPFRLAEQFIFEALRVARIGVAVLVRTVFIESIGRYERLFTNRPPDIFAQFVERVPMLRGRLDRKASTATGYAWLVWNGSNERHTELIWIPPSRKYLEKDSDY